MAVNPVGGNFISAHQAARDIRVLMLDWAREERDPEMSQQKMLFINRVGDFLSSGSNRLEIGNINLTHLPAFFRHPSLIDQLEELVIFCTNLEQIPDWISEMTNLQTLELRNNYRLHTLPNSLADLRNLRALAVTYFPLNEQLHVLEFPENIADLELATLQIEGVDQSVICPWLHSQNLLTSLRLSQCGLIDIPEGLFNLFDLEVLDLSFNNIQNVDDRIDLFQNLEHLNLASNLITSLNDGIFSLDGGCQINVIHNRLGIDELRRIDSIIENDDYRGPQITIDQHPYIPSGSSEEEFENEEQNITDSLRSFYETIGVERPAHIDVLTEDETASRAIVALIGRLQQNIPFSHSFAPQIYAVLAESLSLAAQNPDYRLACFHVIEGATNTCGDGIIAIILRLSLLRQEMLLDLDQPAQVLEFILKGRLAMSVLETSAANHVAGQKIEIINFIRTAHPFISQEQLERLAAQRYEEEIDPVEVYLFYPMALRERLHLPLELTNMLFAAHARVSQEQLIQAAEQVEEKLGDRAFVMNFLVQNELWLKLLEKEFRIVFIELAEKQDRLAEPQQEEDSGEDPYVAFANEKQRALLEATGQLLDRLQSRLTYERELKRARLEKK